MSRALKILALMTLLVVAGGIGVLGWRLVASLPQQEGVIPLSGLRSEAGVASDALGVPAIEARDRSDAFRVLGFLHARDRLFQMDLARRKSAGRLAELFGERVLSLDMAQRHYQVQAAAKTILAALPADQQEVLRAYAGGVNAYMSSLREWPFEILALGYRPDPWRPEDSLLVAFGMFQTLTSQERDERMLTVMNAVLPATVVSFLTPDTDSYTSPLLGGSGSRRPPPPTPVQAIAELLEENRVARLSAAVDPDIGMLGSNQWAVSGTKSRDGRAIVANDMHLGLSVPNIWYRAEIRYGQARLSGVTLPGLPLLVAGSNGRVAWGFTNVDSDVADLVSLDVNPANPEQYRTPQGWREFGQSLETIAVKNGAAVPIALKATVWGPVLPEPLLGRPVAIRWTALDPGGLNLMLLGMDSAATLEQAVAVMNRAGIPPQNVVLADDQGRIAWTYAGFFPERRGFDGTASVSWADGARGWQGFVPPADLPRLFDPPVGFIATANNRTLGAGYPHVIGHNYAHSYRAYRISQRLAPMEAVDEQDLLAVQLDTESEFFAFYRELVQSLASGSADDPLLREAKAAVDAWNGRLDADSLGIALLVGYRKDLLQAVFGPLLARCRRVDAHFNYGWRESETPLRALLTERSAATLPDRRFARWDDFLAGVLTSTVHRLQADYGIARLDRLTWGRVNHVTVRHPFGKLLTWLSPVLDMPEHESPGCSGYCVRVLSADQGASERFVVSPAHPEDGIFHMPAGQSGHPLSPHYRDQQQAWVNGDRLPFGAAAAKHRLLLEPSSPGAEASASAVRLLQRRDVSQRDRRAVGRARTVGITRCVPFAPAPFPEGEVKQLRPCHGQVENRVSHIEKTAQTVAGHPKP